MEIIKVLSIVEIIISVLLVMSIVIQPKEGDAGTLFGGGFAEEVKRTKRGVELFMHNASIVLTILFISVAIALMLLGENQTTQLPTNTVNETVTGTGSTPSVTQ